jgi:hypothetical protein
VSNQLTTPNVTIVQLPTQNAVLAGDSFAAWSATASQTYRPLSTQIAAFVNTNLGLGNMSLQNAATVAITGGSIADTTISITAAANVNLSPSGLGSVTISPNTTGAINNMTIGATTRGSIAGTTGDFNSTLSVTGLSTLTGGFSAGANSSVTGTFGVSGTASLGTGSTHSITVSGSSTNPTIGASGGGLNFVAPNSRYAFSAAANPDLQLVATASGTDLKTWDAVLVSNNYQIQATKDDLSAATTAYSITRGTTYNVASHTWYTSTTAGTPVATMALSMQSAKTNLTITPPTSSAGLATGTLYSNAGVATFA